MFKQIIDLEDIQQDEENRGSEDVVEQNLEDESIRMLTSWDKPLPKQNFREIDNDPVMYYDGDVSFDDMKDSMERLEGGRVFVKMIETNPEGVEIKPDSTIVFDRIGFLEHNPIPIEGSIQDGKPTILSLSERPIIPGLLQALLTMKQGERASVLIHPALGYGPRGAPPLIPKDSYLLYNIKVYKVLQESDLDAAYRYEKNNNMIIPTSEKIKLIREHKDIAKRFFQEGQTREALIKYKAAQEEDGIVKESDREWRELLETLYQNAAIIYNKLEMPKAATKAAKSDNLVR